MRTPTLSPEVLELARGVAWLARAPARERPELFDELPAIDLAEAGPAEAAFVSGWVELAEALVARPYDHLLFAALARALSGVGLLEDALAAIDRAIELAEPSAAYQVARGDLLERLERFLEAGQAFRAALAADPGHAEAHLRTAVAESRVGRDDAARAHLAQAVERDPERAIAWLNLARLEERRGALDPARAALERFRALAPTDPRGAVVEVSLALARGDRAGALALGTVELSQLGATPDLLVNTALAALELGRFPEASVMFERALAEDPGHVPALVGAGVLERRRGDAAQSIRYFEKALDIEPGCAEALLNLGLARAREGRRDAALTLLERALARDPALPAALAARAELTAEDDPAAALADLVRACALAPQDARAWTNRAALELAAGQVDAALASAGRALELWPDRPEALITQARAQEQAGDPVGAETSWRAALAADPDAALGLADLYERTGRAARVPALLAEARTAHLRNWEIAVAASRAARQTGAHSEAVAHALEALAAAPHEPQAVLAHARALIAGGQPQQARARLDMFAQAHPDRADAHLARGQLLVSQLAYDDAYVALATALELDPALAEARPLLVAALVGLDRVDEALAQARATVSADPGRPAAHLALALAADRAGDAAAATAALETAVSLDPGDPALAAVQVRLLTLQRRFPEALAAFAALFPDADRDPRVLRAAGEAAYRTGRFDLAARHFAQALARTDPTAREAIELAVNEALAHLRAGDPAAALERATRRPLADEPAALALAARLVAAGTALPDAAAREPADDTARDAHGSSHDAAERAPADAHAPRNAHAAAGGEDLERACAFLERLVALAPEANAERVELAGLYLTLGRARDAADLLARPGLERDGRAVLQRALALDRAGDDAAAEPLYEELAEAGQADALLNLGLIHRRRGDHLGELACYAEARIAGVPAPLCAVLAGQALALRGRPRRALEALAEADLADPAVAGLAGSLAALVGDARAVPLLAGALEAQAGDPDLAHNLAFACLFAERAADGLEVLTRTPALTGADWLLRAALTEAAHGPDGARALVERALPALAGRQRFLVLVAQGNLAATCAPDDALRAYLTARTLCDAPPRYLLTNLARLLAGPRPFFETLRALANVTGYDTAALAVAAQAAAGDGAPLVDNRALLWLLRSRAGLKFPAKWLQP